MKSIKSAIEITNENERLYEIVYGNAKNTTLMFQTTAVEFKPEYQLYLQLYGEPTHFDDIDNSKLTQIKSILESSPTITFSEIQNKLGIICETVKEEYKPRTRLKDLPDDPAERRKIRMAELSAERN